MEWLDSNRRIISKERYMSTTKMIIYQWIVSLLLLIWINHCNHLINVHIILNPSTALVFQMMCMCVCVLPHSVFSSSPLKLTFSLFSLKSQGYLVKWEMFPIIILTELEDGNMFHKSMEETAEHTKDSKPWSYLKKLDAQIC